MRYSLQQASDDDRVFAETLHELCYHDVVTRQFGAWDPELQQRYFEQKWRPELYRVILCDGAAVGLLAAHEAPDHLYVSDIQIHPARQNQGLASAVLVDLFDRARTLGVPLRLQVLRCNRARALYEKLGFVCYANTENHLLFENRCT